MLRKRLSECSFLPAAPDEALPRGTAEGIFDGEETAVKKTMTEMKGNGACRLPGGEFWVMRAGRSTNRKGTVMRMNTCVVTMRSVTYAMKGQQLLRNYAIDARPVRLNAQTAAKGCAYGLEISCMQADAVVSIFLKNGIPYSGIAERGAVL